MRISGLFEKYVPVFLFDKKYFELSIVGGIICEQSYSSGEKIVR